MKRKTLLAAIGCYAVLLTAFFIASVAVQTIPAGKLYPNVASSLSTLREEGLKHQVLGFPLFRLDNFTDALMLNITVASDGLPPLEAAMRNEYCLTDGRMSVADAADSLMQGKREGLYETQYSRYWHGHQVALRPLLLLTDYKGIRTLNYVCFGLLLGLLCLLLGKRYGRRTAGCFLAALLMVNIAIVPLSLQFSGIFYVAFLSTAAVALRKERTGQPAWMAAIFMATGGLSCFFDLLTVPLVTLGLPLAVYLSGTGAGKRMRHLVAPCLWWLLGYASLWASKWGLAHLFVGYDIVEDAVRQVAFRTSTEYNGFDMSLSGLFSYAAGFAARHKPLAGLCLALLSLFAASLLYLWRTRKQAFAQNACLLAVAVLPVAWCLFARNHSIIHFWFVWRIFTVSIFSLLLFFSQVLLPGTKNEGTARKG